eukprot:scaffold124203_cov17-Tisochrysis_lutea.AAC.2
MERGQVELKRVSVCTLTCCHADHQKGGFFACTHLLAFLHARTELHLCSMCSESSPEVRLNLC